MKSHPLIGYFFLKDIGNNYDIPNLEKISDYVLQHHERPDGKGYPLKLKGNRIDFLTRIISIADAYDAMTSDRVYKRTPLFHESAIERMDLKKNHEDAIIELFINRGKQFDKDIIDHILKPLAIYQGAKINQILKKAEIIYNKQS